MAKILIIIAFLLWLSFLIYDIKESAHIFAIVRDLLLCILLVLFYFIKPKETVKTKTLQQVEDEIKEIESRQKDCN